MRRSLTDPHPTLPHQQTRRHTVQTTPIQPLPTTKGKIKTKLRSMSTSDTRVKKLKKKRDKIARTMEKWQRELDEIDRQISDLEGSLPSLSITDSGPLNHLPNNTFRPMTPPDGGRRGSLLALPSSPRTPRSPNRSLSVTPTSPRSPNPSPRKLSPINADDKYSVSSGETNSEEDPDQYRNNPNVKGFLEYIEEYHDVVCL